MRIKGKYGEIREAIRDRTGSRTMLILEDSSAAC